MTTRTCRLFGIHVWSVTSDEPPEEERGSVTSEVHEFGFVRDDLPTWHRTEEDA